MSIKEYLENLNRLKRLAVGRWGSLNPLERDVLDGAFDWLVDNLEIKRGTIIVDEELSRIMDEFVRAVVDTVNSVPLFQSKLGRFLQDLTTIQTNNKLFHSTTNKFDIDTAGVNDVQKAVVGQIIDQYTANGLNAHFAAPLKDNIFRNILAGANMKDVKEVLRSYILSGEDKSGKLGQYLDQTAMMAVDSYTGAINQQLVNEFAFTGYIISGSLIETSSKQCVFAVEEADNSGGYLSFKDWEEVLNIARNNPKARLIPGTTIKNLPLNKLHWGCRHDFTPVIMASDIEKKPRAEQKREEKPINKIKTAYKEASTMREANQVAKDIFETNTNLKISKITGSSTDTVARRNKVNAILQELTSTYEINPVGAQGQQIKLSFKSTSRALGVVSTSYNGPLLSVNFGDKIDSSRSVEYSPITAPFRNKARVDPENLEVSTTVHEFAHVMTTRLQAPKMTGKFEQFWPELEKLKKEYFAELKEVAGDQTKFAEIFLGRYASTNSNEFLAEGFMEYKLSSSPSKYAKKIGLLVDKFFKK